MYKYSLKFPKGKLVSKPIESKVDTQKKEDEVPNLLEEIMKERKGGPIVLTTLMSQYWDPHIEIKRVELMEHLAGAEGFSAYLTQFPELTVAVMEAVVNISLMGRYIYTGTGIATSDQKRDTAYKHAFFDGPISTDMSAVPVATTYGAPAVEVPANAMKYIGDLRAVLMKNKNWNEAIAKSLWLYGIDGTPFVPAEYVAKYSVNPLPGYLHFHVATKFVHTHNIYIRIAGTPTWDAPIRFDGANFDVHRIPVTPSENLEVMMKGIVDNVETPLPSVILPVTYTGV
jgi:hypothetical protein